MDKINDAALEWDEYDHGATAFRRKELSNAVGASELGCSLYELPPEMRSWPYHYHTANEEALYVLAGEGQLRYTDGEQSLTAGDYVTLPSDERGGHRVVNDGDDPLRYLALSTMNEPDVTVYPEMNKFGVFVGSPPGGRGERPFHGYYRIDDETEYWDS
ncbi:cupin domain-containing protein [Natrialba aegyptia]|uniref:Cupin 2 conserved barrel domain protein n=1 Tax=Natrialba aegyptia DSM 13077 TaxID=1227491 RepID=M0BDT6_9EURY|nr:cupin domain-containing protein [Natrialba aegyptia]ELZ09036.1 Cupin 2 conserved barrel domain protein [Natrialba aegyptia DSM 13077]